MGILNVTPDSFSDGGKYFDTATAIDRGLQIEQEGADFIDVGGESSRPGSDPVTENEEARRVLPVVEALAKKVSIPISIDTYRSGVAVRALEAGAEIINDISGFTFDPNMVDIAVRRNACAVLMHMQGTPKTMQREPAYGDVVGEITEYLETRAVSVRSSGIDRVIVDPGIGFGKTLEHNIALIKGLDSLVQIGYPVLVGVSRKSFIGRLLNSMVDDRLEGTAAAVTASILYGAHIVRVHDVKEMKKIALVADALKTQVLIRR